MNKKIKNNTDFITNITGKKTGFTAPKGYFDSLEDEIFAKKISQNFSKTSGFKTSEKYFENFENQILTKFDLPSKKTKVIAFKEIVLQVIPYAAAAIIILFIGFNSLSFEIDTTTNLNKISETEIENWFNDTNFDTDDISVILKDVLLEENSFSLTSLKDKNIEDYILSKDDAYLYTEIY